MAGSWSAMTYRDGELGGIQNGPLGIVKSFIADHTAASVPDNELLPKISGVLCGADVVFGDPAPSAVVVEFKTVDGISLFISGSLTASGRIEIIPAIPFAGGLRINVTTNATVDAVGTIIPLIFKV